MTETPMPQALTIFDFGYSETPTSPRPRSEGDWRWVPNRADRQQSGGGWWERPMTPRELAREPEERRKDADFIRSMLAGKLRHVGNGNYEE